MWQIRKKDSFKPVIIVGGQTSVNDSSNDLKRDFLLEPLFYLKERKTITQTNMSVSVNLP